MITDIIQSIFPMSHASMKAIIDMVEYVDISKDEVFVRKSQRSNKEYFVLDGVCRSYLLDPEGMEVTISFFASPSIVSPFTTRTLEGVSNLSLQALTDVKLGTMDAGKFENLMVENLEIREFGNTVLRNELKLKVDKEIGMASLTAKERLLKFREHFPLLENLIPHTCISTYLGITNISLSRLRRELMN